VLLWRVLKQVKNGFYIDVGANDPVEHSVTKAFYERGWYGINIEPMPEFFARFEAERPRDINLSIAAGASDGELTMYDVPEVRGWASPDSTVAAAHASEGYRIAELKVPVRRLDGICAQYVDRPIHFLKIDVEGFEGDVLRGMDFVRFRPWVVLVEATLPGSTECNHQEWEHLLLEKDYHFGYFDGLNRYYVSEEQRHLLAQLHTPVNVFDNYINHHLVNAWAGNKKSEQANFAAQQALAQLHRQMAQTHQELTQTRDQLAQARQAHLQAAHEAVQHLQALNDCLQQQQQSKLDINNLHQALATSEQASQAWAARSAALEQQLHALHGDAQAQLQTERQRADHSEQALTSVLASKSWRLTAPLRQFLLLRQKLAATRERWRNQPRAHYLRLALKPLLGLSRNATVRKLVLPVLEKQPQAHALLKQTVAQVRQDPQPPAFAPEELALPANVRELPMAARTILADLNRIIRTPE
jgi:FkbM family methyltransferase